MSGVCVCVCVRVCVCVCACVCVFKDSRIFTRKLKTSHTTQHTHMTHHTHTNSYTHTHTLTHSQTSAASSGEVFERIDAQKLAGALENAKTLGTMEVSHTCHPFTPLTLSPDNHTR